MKKLKKKIRLKKLLNFQRPFDFDILYLLLKRDFPFLTKEKLQDFFKKNIGRKIFLSCHFKYSLKHKEMLFWKKHYLLIKKILLKENLS